MKKYLIPIIIEVVGIAIVATGVGVEIATGATHGYIIISIGSLMVAGGALIWAKFIRWK